MKKALFFIPLLVLASDINPFNAGNVNSNSPYGLTPQEKAIVNNKKKISKLEYEIINLTSEIKTLKLRMNSYEEVLNGKLASIDTILSEVEQNKKNNFELRKRINEINSSVSKINNEINSLKTEVKNLKNKIDVMEKNLITLKDTVGIIVDNQNKNMQYVKKAITDIYNQLKNLKRPLSADEAFNKGRNLFFAGKLNKAKEYFLYSLSKKHLPATSSYYLGEIAYKQKKYNEALAYYKKSVNLYPKKTSFTARLLYHTAISFEKLGDKETAKLTLQKLISDFPDSKYANLAKKELEKSK